MAKVLKPFPVSDKDLKTKYDAIRSFWCDRLTVIEKQPVTDKNTYLTEFDDVIVLEDEPCRIIGQTTDSTTEGEPAKRVKSIDVILDEEIEIKPGSLVRVTNVRGRVYEGKRSGEPVNKSDSQTITIEIEREYV